MNCIFVAYGFLVPSVLLESSLQKERLYSKVYVQKNLIEYRTSKHDRIEAIDECQKKRSFQKQLADSANILIGFTAILNGAASAILCNYLIPFSDKEVIIDPLPRVLGHLALMLIVGDFFLYWY